MQQPWVQAGHLRVVLKASRTVLRKFHQQLGAKCGAFIEVLLSGTATTCALWQRAGAMQAVRQVPFLAAQAELLMGSRA